MKNLIDFENFEHEDFERILHKASLFKKGPRVPFFLPAQQQIANIFLEPSTRTRISFEVAQNYLNLQPIHVDSKTSSVQKGESIYDTLRTIESMGIKTCVIRTTEEAGVLKDLSTRLNIAIVNAGSGISAHPTQALLDLFTIQERFGKTSGLKIAYVGDIAHSRVISSHLQMWSHFNNDIRLCPVSGLEIADYKNSNLDAEIAEVDVLYLVRVQEERRNDKNMLSVEQYHQTFGLTLERYSKMQKNAIVMHPGPFIRDKEIASTLTEKKNVTIDQQVTNGVFMRMAVLDELYGGKASESLFNT